MTRLVLILLPVAVLATMALSALWVPSQDSISVNNPRRLHSIVETSIGDARTLNPILASDVSSARIAELVFDGLLRFDENLQLQGSLATRWQLQERVYITVAQTQNLAALVEQLSQLINEREPELLRKAIVIHSPTQIERELTLDAADTTLALTVNVPTRFELTLSRVVPELEQWFASIPSLSLSAEQRRAYVDSDGQRLSDAQIDQVLPAIEHNPQITFWLRDDVRFHDGHAFDALDVVFTYEAIMEPLNRAAIRASFEPIKTVQALDSHTVQVSYKRLFSPAVNVWTVGILPEHLLNTTIAHQAPQAATANHNQDQPKPTGMREAAFNRQPIGTGAFKFKRWSSDELIHLSRNDDYYLPSPLIKDYYFRIIPDTLTQELEFRSGAADTYRAEPHQAARYRKDPNYRVFSATSPGYTYIGYNLRKAPFNDLRVRKALGMAIDVNAIIRYALFNEGTRITGPFASITRWYDKKIPELGYDPQAAKQLLHDAGWRPDSQGWLSKDGVRLEFNLITNNGNLKRKAVASIVQQAWRQIGVKSNVQLFEWAVFLKDFINPGQFDAVILGWQLGLDADLYQIWHSSQTDANQLNFIGFQDPASDKLIEQFRREYNEDKQQTIAHQLHARVAQLQPYTFLYAPRSTRLLQRNLVMLDSKGKAQQIRAADDGNLFYHMNRWQHLSHDPGF